MAKCKHGIQHSGHNDCDRCLEEFHKDRDIARERYERIEAKAKRCRVKSKSTPSKQKTV